MVSQQIILPWSLSLFSTKQGLCSSGLHTIVYRDWSPVSTYKGFDVECPRNKQTKILVRTETNWKKICFYCVSVCFVKPKTKKFGLFCFVSVFWTYIEKIKTNRTALKQTETTLNFLINTKICSLSTVSVGFLLFGSFETSKLSVSV